MDVCGVTTLPSFRTRQEGKHDMRLAASPRAVQGWGHRRLVSLAGEGVVSCALSRGRSVAQ
ncbi:hypothetical protein E2C01_057319 [Portunus trituberculatus]|uniref:Uncharacterized protein n=1 Tax=Portunus trituberculatus TaxID=210409 RepID=A0A5B7H0Q8_PORTR|nr:hypothetical protein [Portunus trituberculatus]